MPIRSISIKLGRERLLRHASLFATFLQCVKTMVDLRVVPVDHSTFLDESVAEPQMLQSINAQHLQHTQHFKRGLPCVVQQPGNEGLYPSLYQVMDWHVDLLVGFQVPSHPHFPLSLTLYIHFRNPSSHPFIIF